MPTGAIILNSLSSARWTCSVNLNTHTRSVQSRAHGFSAFAASTLAPWRHLKASSITSSTVGSSGCLMCCGVQSMIWQKAKSYENLEWHTGLRWSESTRSFKWGLWSLGNVIRSRSQWCSGICDAFSSLWFSTYYRLWSRGLGICLERSETDRINREYWGVWHQIFRSSIRITVTDSPLLL